jgi:hypothetical protein
VEAAKSATMLTPVTANGRRLIPKCSPASGFRTLRWAGAYERAVARASHDGVFWNCFATQKFLLLQAGLFAFF